MSRKETIIKHLKMMGYKIKEDDVEGFIHVVLMTTSGRSFMVPIRHDELYEDFVIEKVVLAFNIIIIRDL